MGTLTTIVPTVRATTEFETPIGVARGGDIVNT